MGENVGFRTLLLVGLAGIALGACKPPDPPPIHPDPPPIPKPQPPPLPKPKVPHASPSPGALEGAARNDEGVRDVTCFAYDAFYDPSTGQLRLPTSAQFTESVVQALAAPNTRVYWEEKAEAFQNLIRSASREDLISTLTEAGCL